MNLKTYIEPRGRLVALSRAVGVSHSTVLRWAAGRVPAERVKPVSRATGIAPHVLRPDLFEAAHAIHSTQTEKADA